VLPRHQRPVEELTLPRLDAQLLTDCRPGSTNLHQVVQHADLKRDRRREQIVMFCAPH
jgi:hypothetical protein